MIVGSGSTVIVACRMIDVSASGGEEELSPCKPKNLGRRARLRAAGAKSSERLLVTLTILKILDKLDQRAATSVERSARNFWSRRAFETWA